MRTEISMIKRQGKTLRSADFPDPADPRLPADHRLYVTTSTLDWEESSTPPPKHVVRLDKIENNEYDALAKIYRAYGAKKIVVFVNDSQTTQAQESRNHPLAKQFLPYNGSAGKTFMNQDSPYYCKVTNKTAEQFALLAARFLSYYDNNSENGLLTVNRDTLHEAAESSLFGQNARELHGIEPRFLDAYLSGQLDAIAEEKARTFAEFGIQRKDVHALLWSWVFHGTTSPATAEKRLDALLAQMKTRENSQAFKFTIDDHGIRRPVINRLLAKTVADIAKTVSSIKTDDDLAPLTVPLTDAFKNAMHEGQKTIAKALPEPAQDTVPPFATIIPAEEDKRTLFQTAMLAKIQTALVSYEGRFKNNDSPYNKSGFFGKMWQSNSSQDIIKKITHILETDNSTNEQKLTSIQQSLSKQTPGTSLMNALKDFGVVGNDEKMLSYSGNVAPIAAPSPRSPTT